MDRNVYGYIYIVRNKVNNKIYIGQTTNSFDERYGNNFKNRTHNEHLKRSIHDYGIDNFYIDKEFDIAKTQDELNKLEDLYIKAYNSTNPKFGYNKMFGGGASGKRSEETKLKYSICRKGKKIGEKHHLYKKGYLIAGDKNPNYGNGEKIRGINNPMYGVSRFGKENPMYGKKHSTETKEKISVARKGIYTKEKHPMWMKNLSKEHRDNISKGLKGKYTLDKSPNARAVICLTTGKVFGTAKQAGIEYNVDKASVTRCCRGQQKTAGKHQGQKLTWMYHEEYLKII